MRYSETFAILRRRFNSGQFTANDYAAAISALQLQVVESLLFELLPTDDVILISLRLIERHNLNSSDAAILAAFLDYRDTLSPAEQPCVLIASDHRLLRAAQAEGLPIIDPEALTAQDALAFLNTL